MSVTTGTISGIVTDTEGDALPGAVITATHEPTGTHYTTVTRADGRYALREVRAGGPYDVVATMTGFKTQVRKNLFVRLGEDLPINFELRLATVEE